MKYIKLILRQLLIDFLAFRKGIKAYDLYSKLIVKKSNSNSQKVVFIDINKNVYNRYLYTLVKFFLIEGYDVYLPKKFRLFSHLHLDSYALLLLEESHVYFGLPKSTHKAYILNKQNLSPAYFLEMKQCNQSQNTFHVPISQHPLMYNKCLWNIRIENSDKRKKSVFMIGNFKEKWYSRLEKDNVFKVLSRVKIYSYIKKQSYFSPIDKQLKLNSYIDGLQDNKVIIINSSDFKIPMEELRYTLSKFNFFFALPGFAIPFSHNIVEAMSVGTIPLIQKGYANMFQPSLKHRHNAFIFDGLHDLDDKITEAFNISEVELFEIRKNVSDYYKNYMTPTAVVGSIVNSDFKKIFLQAEQYSVDLILSHPRKYKL